jgi:hypothetical protein
VRCFTAFSLQSCVLCDSPDYTQLNTCLAVLAKFTTRRR